MMKRVILSLLAGVALSLPVIAAASDIGYVDMERVIKESKLGRAAEARLKERFADKIQPFAEREANILRQQEQFKRDRPLMSAAEAKKRESQIQEQIAAFEKDSAGIQQELAQAQQEEGRKILTPARAAVIAVAKKQKLGAVFEANQPGLLYLDERLDITDAVIADLDAQHNDGRR